MIGDLIGEWIKGILIDGIMGNLSGLFNTVNTKVGEIASDVGSTPQDWNGGIFSMLQNLSETVIVPIAAAILALVMCYELIDMIVEKNNMHDFDSSMFFRWIFKSAFAILIVTNTWNIVMGVFDATQQVVNQSAGVIIGDTSIDFDTLLPDLESRLERQAGRMIRSGVHRHKLKPYRAAAKAERKSIAANAEFAYQKSLRDHPELAQAAKNPVSRFWQKQHIKREYAKAARAAGQTAQGAASTAKTTAAAAKKAAEKSRQAASFAARHWKGALIVGGVGLMLLLVMGGLQSCTAMFGSTGTGLAATSYLSEDSDMLGAEAAYAALEADLQHELDDYESLHPGYDEYRFDLDEIKHDPYLLTSILSALHNGVFTLGEVQGDLAMLFEKQYILTQTIETETRYRTETRTDSEGNTYTVEVPYTYYICNVKLENFDLSHLPIYILTEEQMGFYAAYMQTLGNRPDLFPNGSYPHASTPKEPTYYEIPPEALKDEAFAAMIAEAEKYVGYPYVWGGSSPSTSFDCSGFISWVINHSGWNVGRQTAQGLYNICTPVSPEQAKPGDLVFFVGTYDTAGMSHVGLYVGNSVMLHCGDPISYTNLNSSYWQQHFYCYGRLP